jgi:DNA polymerase III delta prime subunit
MKKRSNEYSWAQKYRPPKLLDENGNLQIIYPKRYESEFLNTIKQGYIENNYLFIGPPGLGKTTTALALVHELENEYLFIRGKQANINTLRNLITDFLSTKSHNKKQKVVIFDEGDRATYDVLEELKSIMEQFSSNGVFIITSNNGHKFSSATKSRTTIINFDMDSDDKKYMIKSIFNRCVSILKKENVEFEKAEIMGPLVNMISNQFPDIRSILKNLQNVTKRNGYINEETGEFVRKLPSDFHIDIEKYDIKKFKEMLLKFNYEEIKKFVENSSSELLYKSIFENINEFVSPEKIMDVLSVINSAGYQEAFVPIKQVNTIVCLNELKNILNS